MKRLLLGLTFLSTLSFFSCTTVLYTQDQVLSQLHTKSDVVNRFGLSTEKRTGEGIEEWIYNYGTVSRISNYGNSNSDASIYGGYNSVNGNLNTNTMNVAQFSQFTKYLKFTFDQNGNVLRCQGHGVDLSVKKQSSNNTLIYILGVVGGGVALGLLMSSTL